MPLLRIVELLLLLRTAELLRAGVLLLLLTVELLRVGVVVRVVVDTRLLFTVVLVRTGVAVARVVFVVRVVTLCVRELPRPLPVLTLPRVVLPLAVVPRVDVVATRSVVRTLVLPKVRDASAVPRVDTRVVVPLPSAATRVVPALRTAA